MGDVGKKVAGAALGVAGGIITFALGWTGAGGLLGVGLMAGGAALYSAGNQPPDQGEYSGSNPIMREQGHQVNTTSSNKPLSLIYGVNIVGVNRTYVSNQNPYLYMVLEIGEGEHEGIERADGSIWSTPATFLPYDNPPLIYFEDILWTDFIKNRQELASIKWYSGSSNQMPEPELQAIDPTYNEALRHTAYLYVKLKYDKDIFKKIPRVTLKVKGLKVKDLNGDNYSYSYNPANVIQDLLIRPSFVGGLGLTSDRLDINSFVDVSNHCINNIPPGMTDPISSQLTVINDSSISEIIKLPLSIIPGELIYSYDKIKLVALNINFEPVVMSFDEKDIVSDGSMDYVSYKPSNTFSKRPNTAKSFYTNPALSHKVDSFTFSDPSEIQNVDYREMQLNLYACQDVGWVQILTYYYLEKARATYDLNIRLGERAFPLEPMDLISISYADKGWTDKLFRVIAPNRNPDRTVDLFCNNENIEFYNQVYQLTTANYDQTNLPDPNTTPSSVSNIEEYEDRPDYRLRSFTRWVINFDPPSDTEDPFWDYAEVYLKIGDSVFINNFNDNLLPNNITTPTGVTATATNQVLRVQIDNATLDPYVSIWNDTLPTIDPNNHYKLRVRIQYDSGTYEPSTDWQGVVSYFNATDSGKAYLASPIPGIDQLWITLDFDLHEDYQTGVRYKDMGSITEIRLSFWTDNYPGDVTFKLDDISLGDTFSASDWKYITRSEGNYIRENVVEGDHYFIKFVSVNIWGTKEDFSKASGTSRVIRGLIGGPIGDFSVASFVPHGNDLVFLGRWGGQTADIEGFEMRRGGTTFTDGYLVSRSSGVLPNITLRDCHPDDTQGSFNFHVAPFNNAGQYGLNTYSQSVSMPDPIGLGSPSRTATWDYSTGQHFGTERYNHNGNWVLRVDHTGGNLEGYWISDVERLQPDRLRIAAGNFRTEILTGTYTWETIFGSGTWADRNPDRTKRWSDFIAGTLQPTLRGTLYFGTSSPPTEVKDLFHVAMANAYGQYYQIRIDLVDPTSDYYLMVREFELDVFDI